MKPGYINKIDIDPTKDHLSALGILGLRLCKFLKREEGKKRRQ
jgi:hypothetical protein